MLTNASRTHRTYWRAFQSWTLRKRRQRRLRPARPPRHRRMGMLTWAVGSGGPGRTMNWRRLSCTARTTRCATPDGATLQLRRPFGVQLTVTAAQVLVKYGTRWCQQCKALLPTFVDLTGKVRYLDPRQTHLHSRQTAHAQCIEAPGKTADRLPASPCPAGSARFAISTSTPCAAVSEHRLRYRVHRHNEGSGQGAYPDGAAPKGSRLWDRMELLLSDCNIV